MHAFLAPLPQTHSSMPVATAAVATVAAAAANASALGPILGPVILPVASVGTATCLMLGAHSKESAAQHGGLALAAKATEAAARSHVYQAYTISGGIGVAAVLATNAFTWFRRNRQLAEVRE